MFSTLRASLWACQPPSNRLRNQEETKVSLLPFFLDYGLAIGGGAYRAQAKIYTLRTVHADLL